MKHNLEGMILMLDVLKEAIGMLDADEKIELYGFLRKDLKDSGAIQTYNMIGEFGERAVINFYNNSSSLTNLRPAKIGMKCFDVINKYGERYSIKATTNNQTSVFNGLNDKGSALPQKRLFEYIIIVVLDEDMSSKVIYELDWDAFLSLKKWHNGKRTWYLSITNELKRKAKILYSVDKAV